MEYRQLGATGTRVSELCFGTWRFGRKTGGVLETDEDDAHELLDAFADHGGNYIDCANIYGDPNGTSESYIGSWLEDRDREKYVLTSKVYFEYDSDNPNGSGLSRTHIRNRSTKRSKISAQTTWTSTISTAGMKTPQSKRRSLRSTDSSKRAKSTIWVPQRWLPGN